MAENDTLVAPLAIDKVYDDGPANRLANDVQRRIWGCLKKPFDQSITAEICSICQEATEKSRVEDIGLSISNPLRATLHDGTVYQIYFKDCVIEGFDGKVMEIPSGAVYKELDGDVGVTRVW